MAPRMRRDQRIRDTHRAQGRQIPPAGSANAPPHSAHMNGTILGLAIPSFTCSNPTPPPSPSVLHLQYMNLEKLS